MLWSFDVVKFYYLFITILEHIYDLMVFNNYYIMFKYNIKDQRVPIWYEILLLSTYRLQDNNFYLCLNNT